MAISQNYIKLILGLKIKQLRQEQNYSLVEFATKCGLSVSYLNEIESGKKYPKSEKILQISNALGVSYDKLISLKLTKQLAPIGELFESNIFEQLPLDHYGIDIQKFISLMSRASLQLSALVSTIIEMGKNTEQSDNNFSRTALRVYKEFSDNYFNELEIAVENFTTENKISKKITKKELESILIKKYFYKIDYNSLNNYAELSGERAFLKQGKTKTLFLNKNLSNSQIIFILGKEIAYNYLKFKDRSQSHSSRRLKNFDHLLNNLKVSYFSTALIINKNIFIPDLKKIFEQKKWNQKILIDLIKKYDATPEMVFQRICNLVSKCFGISKFFFYRFSTNVDGKIFNLSKEIKLNTSRHPGGFKSNEHYCRRWISITTLQKLISQNKAKADKNLILSGILHSKFYNSSDEFLSISLAKQNQFIPTEFYSVTIGFEFDKNLRDKIIFAADKSIPIETVNDTCEMCLIKDCKERVVPQTSIEKIEKEKKVEELLSNLISD